MKTRIRPQTPRERARRDAAYARALGRIFGTRKVEVKPCAR
jgi:hypothetical protein